MIKNVVFDIGKVLIRFEPRIYIGRNVDDKEAEIVYKAVFMGEEWVKLDRGTLTDEEAIEIVCKKYPKNEKCIRDIMLNWHEMQTPLEDTVKVYRKLKENGYKIYLLSNYHESAFHKIYEKYDFIRQADGGIISSSVKYLKPEEEIYKCLLEKYNLIPKECVFIDDTLDNVKAAEKIGFNIVHFVSAEDLIDRLSNMGVRI